MKSSYHPILCIAVCILFSMYSSDLPAQRFLPFLGTLEQKAVADKDKEIENYLASQQQVPIIEGDSIIFIAHASHNAKPTLLADFNGFLNTRYVKDQALGNMKPIPGSHWYYFIQRTPKDGIVNYAYKYGEHTQSDPLNPNQRLIFGGLTSFVAMPAYPLAPETVMNHSIPKGEVRKMSLASKELGHERTLHIYLPPNYEEKNHPLPTLYLHDGTFYVEEGRVPQILDYLIAHQMIQPVIAVFDDPVIRGKEYRGDEAFRKYIGKELVPYIDQTFKTSKKASDRAIIGGSRGGLSALHLSHALPHFANCGVFSPAILPMPVPDFVEILEDYPHSPQKTYVSGSTFDHIWYQDAVELKEYFNKKSAGSQYQEVHNGHNIAAWCRLLDDMLMYFFPASDN